MVFKALYMVGPAHTYVRLFTAEATNFTYAAIGSLTMTAEDWAAFRQVLEGGHVEIVEQDRPDPDPTPRWPEAPHA